MRGFVRHRGPVTGVAVVPGTDWVVTSAYDSAVGLFDLDTLAFYRALVREGGGGALEVGCGAGRLLLALREEGLPVEGCDVSAAMLEACRREAAARGVEVTLHHQAVQELALPGRYAVIYVPCAGLKYLPGREAVLEALRRCHAHLEPGGTLALSLFPPGAHVPAGSHGHSWPGPWTLRSDRALPDGSRLRVSVRITAFHAADRRVSEERVFERFREGRLVERELLAGDYHELQLREVLDLLVRAGFGGARCQVGYGGAGSGGEGEGAVLVFTASRDT